MGNLNITQALSKTAKLVKDSIGENLNKLDNAYGAINNTVTTGGTATAYTATVPGFTYTNGALVLLKFHAPNGDNPTININGLGAKSILVDEENTIPINYLQWDTTIFLRYIANEYGSYFDVVGAKSCDLNYSLSKVAIGRWANGSIIYRTCFYGNMDVQEKSFNISPSKYMLRCDIHIYTTGNGQTVAIPLQDTLANGTATYNTSNLRFRAPSSSYYGATSFYSIVIEMAG